jgi:hypothetical protein
MPRKLKVVDINEPVAVNVEANPVIEFPNSEPLPNVEPPVVAPPAVAPPVVEPPVVEPPAVEPPAVEPSTAEPVVAVKKRAPRARTVKPKKDLEPVQEEIPVEVKVEEPPPPPPPPAVVEEPVEEPPKKNVKTVELVECEKCGKKLTQRTLKYSHPAVCPKNDPPPESTQKPKKQRSTVEAPPQEVEAPQTLGMVRRVRKNERYKELIVHAF